VDDLQDRLVRCFSSAFPTLTETEIRGANVAVLSDMDSLAGVTLVALIDEEFGVDMDLESLLELDSFEAIQEHLRMRSRPAPTSE
jgi:acyl carrier protein